jgi:hypothetical protein
MGPKQDERSKIRPPGSLVRLPPARPSTPAMSTMQAYQRSRKAPSTPAVPAPPASGATSSQILGAEEPILSLEVNEALQQFLSDSADEAKG